MKEFDGQILDYLEGQLSPEEKGRFEGEMFDRSGKRALVDDYEKLLQLEREAAQVDTSANISLSDAILAGIREEPTFKAATFFDASFYRGFLSAGAICLLFFTLLGPGRVMTSVEQLASSGNIPRVDDRFQTVSLGTKDGLPPSSSVTADKDIEVLIELSSGDGRGTQLVTGLLRVGRLPGSKPTLILEEKDERQLERVKRLIGI